jgi:hypothetical protein
MYLFVILSTSTVTCINTAACMYYPLSGLQAMHPLKLQYQPLPQQHQPLPPQHQHQYQSHQQSQQQQQLPLHASRQQLQPLEPSASSATASTGSSLLSSSSSSSSSARKHWWSAAAVTSTQQLPSLASPSPQQQQHFPPLLRTVTYMSVKAGWQTAVVSSALSVHATTPQFQQQPQPYQQQQYQQQQYQQQYQQHQQYQQQQYQLQQYQQQQYQQNSPIGSTGTTSLPHHHLLLPPLQSSPGAGSASYQISQRQQQQPQQQPQQPQLDYGQSAEYQPLPHGRDNLQQEGNEQNGNGSTLPRLAALVDEHNNGLRTARTYNYDERHRNHVTLPSDI